MAHKESAAKVWGKRPIFLIVLALFALMSTALAEENEDQELIFTEYPAALLRGAPPPV
jgi:hypothetical protein